MANAGVVNGTRDAAPAAWKRYVTLMLEACRTDGATPLPPPPTLAHIHQAMRRLART
jgi:hypothetical protein